MSGAAPAHPAAWKWWICGLLLFASAINYMDRQTLSNAAVRITSEFHLTQEQYGTLELAFGWAFAAGSLCFGILADRISVRWLYPIVLVAWSMVGFATGLVRNYDQLLWCRFFLGLFEAAHWPCALKTTQKLLAPEQRTMGNSVLQSGASIGAIVTPLLMAAMLRGESGSWRFSFQMIGAVGIVWIFFWFALVRKDDLNLNPASAAADASGARSDRFRKIIFCRQFLALLIMVALINTSWQLLRAWLPKFMQEGRGYAEAQALQFNALYYVATDVGCIGAGALTLWFHRRGLSVHRSRAPVYLCCALLTAATALLSFLPQGPALLAVLLLVGMGALGVFPCYYAWSQELSTQHQGKVTGITGVAAWIFSAPAHKLFGRLIDRTGSFDLGLAIAGLLPLMAFIALILLWNGSTRTAPAQTVSAG